MPSLKKMTLGGLSKEEILKLLECLPLCPTLEMIQLTGLKLDTYDSLVKLLINAPEQLKVSIENPVIVSAIKDWSKSNLSHLEAYEKIKHTLVKYVTINRESGL